MMTTRTLAATVAATSMAMVGTAAHGALLVHEGFDHAPGLYILPYNDGPGSELKGGIGFGDNGWFGHRSDETVDFRITDGGVGGTYLDGAGGMTWANNVFRTRRFGQAVGDSGDGGVIWAGARLSSGGDGGGGLYIEASSGHHHAIIEIQNGTYTLRGAHGGAGGTDASSIVVSTDLSSPDLVVLRFENLADNQMTVQAWVNPTAASEAGLGAADMSLTFTASSTRSLGNFSIAPGTARFDDLMVFENYSDLAIPEPASLALMGLGGMLMLRRKRD